MKPLDRSKKITRALKDLGIDSLLLNAEANVSYAAGFLAKESYALVTPRHITLITDFRYVHDYAQKSAGRVRVMPYKTSLFQTVTDIINNEGCHCTGFESRHLTFAECELLNSLKDKKSRFIPLKETLEPLRMIKDHEELAKIRRGIAISLATYRHIQRLIKPGTTELEIAAEIEKFIRHKGARSNAFDTIIASGPHSSYPHASISPKKLKKGEPVVIDMGVDYEGYKCDLTRTFFLGKIPASVQKAARIVREAQRLAIEAIKPGVLFKDIDAAARNYIRHEGFGEHFGHALGHGVGLEVHEAPSVNNRNQEKAQAGMVFTVEPGIYLAGEFGIRMEEMVLVTNTGVEVLSVRP